ncbi:MAG: TonB-dependent receptor domain-containing protein [Candidatus Thorarchaeota archaeon]
MKVRIVAFGLVVFALLVTSVSAQPPGYRRGDFNTKVSITGTVVDSTSNQPLKYANVMLYDLRDSLLTGTITNDRGYFRLKDLHPGIYRVTVKFIGFHKKTIGPIKAGPRNPEIDLGVIALKPAVLTVGEVEVTAERPEISYKIDRKVINVSKHFTRTSGTAVDVLENIPSVTVDVDGNVSLRGTGSFQVLIDGRPTPLKPNEALQQIPASTIETIEIITNPSAKYDPDGIAGIINVNLKKGRLQGASGIFNLTGGLDYKYGGDIVLSKRGDGFTLTFGADFNNREYPGSFETENRTSCPDCAWLIESSGAMRWERRSRGIRGEIEWNASQSDIVSVGLHWGRMELKRSSGVDFFEYETPDESPDHYTSRSGWNRSIDYYSTLLSYTRKFDPKGHELSAEAIVSRSDADGESRSENFSTEGALAAGRRSTEGGPWRSVRASLDYVLPFDDNRKFEAGYQVRVDISDDENGVYEYDDSSGTYEYKLDFSHTIEYERNIQSLYGMYSTMFGRAGFQLGLRGEYTYRSMHLTDTDERFRIDRLDFFPTFHVSFERADGEQLMASYSRRIERPRNWYLEPYLTWLDANNVRRGNPDLKPEYVDSYEMGFQKSLGRSMVSIDVYYRLTHNKVERVESVYQDEVHLHSIENVGTDYALGTELMFNLGPARFWNVNLMANLYDYRIEGRLHDEDFSEESFSWNLRLNNTFRLGRFTRIQLNSMYNSSRASAQGTREGFFVTDVGIKQDLMDGNLSVALQARDILRTGRFERTSEGRGFSEHRIFKRKSPYVTLSISYNINNYKRKRDELREEVPGGLDEGAF